ncbi:hypothetical protein EXIGLDRAFT_706116 [Exidia glandulosa HHB12029]|uniref:Malate dehydrogenase n=1 Tax=Exidia glandulosa HHB12029 TaxID=1314781 RepID=A0A165KBV5_EXIGL|nr:hypothetical protein EXIGLDRAFT_706116 [Exidia glandulosa HHB12029]
MRASVFASVALFAASALGGVLSPSPVEGRELKISRCDVSSATLPLPAPGTTAIAAPNVSVAKPKFIAVGLGVQNYTCNAATGTYTSAGAVASLFDISCLASSPLFPHIQDIAFALDQAGPIAAKTLEAILGAVCLKLGDHYFVTSPSGTGISPKFDFTKSMHDSNAFVLAARAGGVAAPNTAEDVDWLQLSNVQGALAKFVYRVQTKGGQPAKTCAGTEFSSVPYAAQYWLTAVSGFYA